MAPGTSLTSRELKNLCQVAEAAAQAAGELIQQYANQPVEVEYKSGRAGLAAKVVTQVDRLSEALILEHLADSMDQHDFALLTEEREDDRERLVKPYFWCIDPMDGTLAFTEGHAGYAVSIALVSRFGKPVIGVTYDPVTRQLRSAIAGLPGLKPNPTLVSRANKDVDVFHLPCDRSLVQHPKFQKFLAELETWSASRGFAHVETSYRSGAVLNACKVIASFAGCYFKPPKAEQGGGSLWDFAATACLLVSQGGSVSSFDGKPLMLNPEASTYMNHCGVLYASTPEIADVVQSLWRQSGS